MLYFQFLVVAAVFGAIAWVAAGRGGGLDDPRRDRPEPVLAEDRQLGKADIDSARFAVGWRGYRMDQVDRLLDRLAAEIEHRDRVIADLTRPADEQRFGEGVGYEPVARIQDRVPPEAAAGGSGATTATAVVQPGLGPGVGPAPEAPEPAPPADQGPAEDNPLSSWYRRPEGQ